MSTYVSNVNAVSNHALQFAIVAHGNQVRKGNEHIPYVYHCIDVVNEVIYYSGLPVDELKIASIIALLHDTVEDTVVTLQDIEDQFGTVIAEGVAALTKDDSITSHAQDSKRKQLTENLKRLKFQPAHTQVVKLADRISNLKCFPAMWSRGKIFNYLEEARLIADVLGGSSEGLSARLLSRVVETRKFLSIIS